MRLINADALLYQIRGFYDEPPYCHEGDDWFVGIATVEELVCEQPIIVEIPDKKMNDADEDISPEDILAML